MDEIPSYPLVDNVDYIEITPFGAYPTPIGQQASLEELEDYAINGTSFESNVDDIEENWLTYVSDTETFLRMLQTLLSTHDIEALLALLEKNNDYLTDSSGEMIMGATPYYIQVLLRPDLFSYDDIFYLFSSLKGNKTVDSNGKEIKIPLELKLRKEDVYFKIVGLDMDHIEELIEIWEKVDKIYKEIDSSLDAEFYKTVRQLEMQYYEEDYPLDEYICRRIADYSPLAKEPSYIIHVEEMSNIEQVLEDLKKPDDSYILDIDSLQSNIRRDLVKDPSSVEYYRWRYSLSKTRFALEKSLFLNRLFGPVNRRVGDDLLGDDICSIYGGCRMFTCPCLEGVDWFTGYCMHCFKRIEHLCNCLRIPAIEGRWYGCYCSFDCVESAIRIEYQAEVDFDTPDRGLIQKKLSAFSTFVPLYFFHGAKNIIEKTGIFNMNGNDPNVYVPRATIYEIEQLQNDY